MIMAFEKKTDTKLYKPKEKWRIIKNIVIISFAFVMHFTAYNGAANLQSSINASGGLGTASLAAVYAGLIVSNLFLPAVIIKWLGCKWSMAVSFVAYMPYIIVQLWPSFYTLMPAGLSVGFGGGPLWCAKCTYITVTSAVFSQITGQTSQVVVTRFFGLFFLIFQLSSISGNLISSLVITSGNNTLAGTSLNESEIPEVCGANFLSLEDASFALNSQSAEKIQLIAGIYLACMIAACLIIVVGVDSLKRYEKDRVGSATNTSGFNLLIVTFKLLKEPNQLLMVIICVWLGLALAFFGADYNSAFVSCVLGSGYIGYVIIANAIANGFSIVLTGYLTKLTGRWVIMVGAAILHTAILIMLLSWRPQAHEGALIYVMSALWGACDGVWNVQINSLCGILFPDREAAAYSNFKLWESLGFIIAYIYSPYLRTSVKLIILLIVLLCGLLGYLIVEYRLARVKTVQISFNSEKDYKEKGCDNICFNKIE